MWFQDLFNYDFRRTEQCIIPYATQEGEISFCAYNTGVGWRNIVEKMHMTATLTKWYEEHGRHEIFAGGKKVGLETTEHTLKLVDEHVNADANDTLDKLGIAKNARQEKFEARDEIKEEAEKARMMALYKEHVLGEKPAQVKGLRAARLLGGIKPAPPQGVSRTRLWRLTAIWSCVMSRPARCGRFRLPRPFRRTAFGLSGLRAYPQLTSNLSSAH